MGPLPSPNPFRGLNKVPLPSHRTGLCDPTPHSPNRGTAPWPSAHPPSRHIRSQGREPADMDPGGWALHNFSWWLRPEGGPHPGPETQVALAPAPPPPQAGEAPLHGLRQLPPPKLPYSYLGSCLLCHLRPKKSLTTAVLQAAGRSRQPRFPEFKQG